MQRAAGAAAAKGDRADAEARPSVFRKGGSAADHERRTEAVHGDGLFANCDEAVEVSSVEISAMRGSGLWVRCASFSSTIKKRRSPSRPRASMSAAVTAHPRKDLTG